MEKDLECRGLCPECFKMKEADEGLQALLNYVKHDPACWLEVRHDYLSCYYRGGSIFKLTFNVPGQTLTFEMDKKYLKLEKTSPEKFSEQAAWLKTRSKDPRQWMDHLNSLKLVMDAWFAEHPKGERSVQQKLVEINSFANGRRCQAIDQEWAIPRHTEFGRTDIVAVRQEGERYVPVLIELKNGTKAFNSTSGIKAHYNKMMRFLKEENSEAYLVETIRGIWASKVRLGLLKDPVPEAGAFDETELMFAVTNWATEDVKKIRRKFPEKLERNVWVAAGSGEAVYFDEGMLFSQRGE